ncbi:MAG: DUF5684 domain-containing protein [Salibacteraceae bacterium]
MEAIIELWNTIYGWTGPGIFIVGIILGFIGIVGQWSLYDKCGLPGVACLVPFWNIIVFLKIVGRPWWQMFYLVGPMALLTGLFVFMEPGIVQYASMGLVSLALALFTIRVYIELCNSFGKYNKSEYMLIVLFNGFYVLNLGLSYNTKYQGPVYGKKASTENSGYEAGLKHQPA